MGIVLAWQCDINESRCSGKTANMAKLRGKLDKKYSAALKPLEFASKALYSLPQVVPIRGAHNTPGAKVRF